MKVAFICPSCRATVQAPPSLEGEEAPCPKCNADIDRWPAPVGAPAAVRVIPPPVEPAVWYYAVNGARRGPVTSGQLRSLIESGAVRTSDLLWREGMPAWVEAGTIPELFPADGRGRASAPPPAPPPASEDNEDDRTADRRPIHVHVKQVIEREEAPRRRPRPRPRCPYCRSPAHPFYRQQVTAAGWAVFVILLIFTIIFCFIGLMMTEEVAYCPDCGAQY